MTLFSTRGKPADLHTSFCRVGPQMQPCTVPDIHLAPPRAAYIHVPFCARRCGYCDFTLVAGRDELVDPYLQALEIELQQLQHRNDVESLFFGGGTPTQLSASQLSRLFTLVQRWLIPTAECEITVEANPAGLDDDKLAVLAGFGVNRISLGVQSFDDDVLRTLGRDHSVADINASVDRVRRHVDNIALDLIFAVPGQSIDSWRQTLGQSVGLAPQHVSTYGLTYEKGTAFWSERHKGQLALLDEELERSMYAAAMDNLDAAGFEQYELSNFARPGFRCRHNEVYWRGESYYGFGPGAARYIDGCRQSHHRSVTTWLKRVLASQSAVTVSERLAPEDRARETAVLGLRMMDGIDRDDFRQRTRFEFDRLAPQALHRHCQTGLLEDDGARVRLTREGRFLADSVIQDFL